MIYFISSLFQFVDDCMQAPFPGLNMTIANFTYGIIAISISLVILARLLSLHAESQFKDTETFTYSRTLFKAPGESYTQTRTSRRKIL